MNVSGGLPLPVGPESRILVRANNWIGDVVLSTPALHALRVAFPGAELSVLAKPWVIPVLRHNPDIDRILIYDARGRHKGIRGVHRLALDLKKERFDCAILLQRAFEAAWISFLARIPVRIGYRTDGRSLLLTHSIRASREEFLVPRVEHNLSMLDAFGVPPADTKVVLNVGQGDLARARERLATLGVGREDVLFGLSPGATFGSAKRWLPERFASLSDRLAGAHRARGIVFGGPAERELGESVSRLASSSELVNLAGLTQLEEAIALIGSCGLFITNDSGLMHVAAALDVPLVAVFGPTDPRTTSPWSRRHVVVRKEGVCCSPCLKRECDVDHRCMRSISVDDVLGAAEGLVERYGWESVRGRQKRLEARSGRAVPVVILGE